jgi:pimeloyl-ACP methyl ester carboxylesterase
MSEEPDMIVPAPDDGVRCGYVDAGGLQVHFRMAGDPASADRLVVLLHQTPLSARHLAPLLPELATDGAAVAFDTPGYGASPAPTEEWTLERYAATFWEAVDALGAFRKVELFGRATGTVLAVEMARQRPDVVDRIAVYGLPLYTDEERAERLASVFGAPYVPVLDGSHVQGLWDRIRGQYPQLPAADVEIHLRDHLATEGDFGRGYRAMWRYDLRSNVAALPMPLLSIGGTADRVNPYFARVVEHLPEAEHVELEGADDFLAERDPARLGALLRRFFDLPEPTA